MPRPPSTARTPPAEPRTAACVRKAAAEPRRARLTACTLRRAQDAVGAVAGAGAARLGEPPVIPVIEVVVEQRCDDSIQGAASGASLYARAHPHIASERTGSTPDHCDPPECLC